MKNDILWVPEGFVLDEAGNLITTSYVDPRAPRDRTVIRTLIKGCRREHALEDGETILISPVRRFREEGENLVRDKQEGLATVESEAVEPETPAEVFIRRRLADVDEAVDLLDSGMTVKHRRTSRRVRNFSKGVAFGHEWWIFSTAIKPESDEELAAWRATLDPAYDHVSEIGQPAKFAEALARMIAEQVGPQGKNGWMQGSVRDGGDDAPKTKHATQWVVHGPMVYTDSLYEALTRDADEATRIAALMFTKSKTHAAQREYRFAVLRDGAVAEKVLLTISGMMRDALQPTASALVRQPPRPAEASARAKTSPSKTGRTRHEVGASAQRATAQQRVSSRETTRSEIRGADGVVSSSQSTERERVHEKTVTWDPSTTKQEVNPAEMSGGRAHQDDAARTHQPLSPDGFGPEPRDEDAIQEIAVGELGFQGRETESGVATGMRGIGRNGGSFEEMFRKILDDPASPMPPSSEPWAEEKLSREEVLRIHRWMATLAHKVGQVAIEHREATSSACWHAIQCIRNIYVRLGDIVHAVWIARQRFVVLKLRASDESTAIGRIVVAPSGAYAYSFRKPSMRSAGHSEGQAGKVFFPAGDLGNFESFGWPPKDD